VILGWSLVRVLVKQALTKRAVGLSEFQEAYGAEGLNPVDKSDRERMPRFGNCIACGRCDIGEGERIAASNGAYPGLMQLVLASTRNMPDYDAAAHAFAHVPEEVLRQKEPRCPTRIPFAELARFVTKQAIDGDGRGVH